MTHCNRKKLISSCVLMFSIIFLGYYSVGHLGDFKQITRIPITYAIAIYALYIPFLIVNGIFLKLTTIDFGINMKFLEYTSISILTTFGNIFLPFRAGFGIRAVYLRSKYGFDYTSFLASMAGNYIVIFNLSSLIALAATAKIYCERGYWNSTLTIILLAIALFTLYTIFFAPESAAVVPFKPVRDRADSVLQGWSVIRKSKKNIFYLFLLSLVNLLLMALITSLEFSALGITDVTGSPITFLQSVFLATLSSLSLLVGITPGALGVREGILMLTSQFVSIAPAQMLAVSILDRAINFSLLLILFKFASRYLHTLLGRSPEVRGDGPGTIGYWIA